MIMCVLSNRICKKEKIVKDRQCGKECHPICLNKDECKTTVGEEGREDRRHNSEEERWHEGEKEICKCPYGQNGNDNNGKDQHKLASNLLWTSGDVVFVMFCP